MKEDIKQPNDELVCNLEMKMNDTYWKEQKDTDTKYIRDGKTISFLELQKINACEIIDEFWKEL